MAYTNQDSIHVSDDHSYFNASVFNPKESTTLKEVSFNKNYTQPLLYNTQDYYLTIPIMKLPARDLPVMDLKTFEDSSGDNLLAITFSFGGSYYTSRLSYPSPSPDGNNPNNEYILDIQTFVKMINTALSTAFALIPGLGASEPDEAPYCLYDSLSTGMDIRFQSQYSNNTVRLYFSRLLYGMFPNYLGNVNSNRTGVSATDELIYFQFNVEDLGDNLYGTGATGIPSVTPPPPNEKSTNDGILIMSQTHATWYLVYTFERIIITTTMPVSQENVDNGSTSAQVQVDRVLTTFSPEQFGYNNQTRSPFLYIPQPVYRLIDMQNGPALTRVNFKILWEDKFNERHPFYLSPGSQMSIKMLFVKKSVYHNRYIESKGLNQL